MSALPLQMLSNPHGLRRDCCSSRPGLLHDGCYRALCRFFTFEVSIREGLLGGGSGLSWSDSDYRPAAVSHHGGMAVILYAAGEGFPVLLKKKRWRNMSRAGA